jgi:DNA-directed RNA polymerase subunit RPC12/RpoP
MIQVIIPAQYKRIEYLSAECESCGALLHFDQSDRRSDLEDGGILCPECGGFISQFKRHIEKVNLK